MTNQPIVNERTKMVLGLLKTPPPRNVPPELLSMARNLIDTIKMWFFLVACIISTFFTIAVLIIFWSSIPDGFHFPVLLFLLLVDVLQFIVPYKKYRDRKIALKILESGIVCKARISKIKRMQISINGNEHSELFLEVKSPDGSIANAVDIIDNRCVELFFTLRDEGKEIDVLFNPDYPTKAISIDRLLVSTRDWDH